MNCSLIVNALKMRYSIFVRPSRTLTYNGINIRYLHATKMCRRKSLQEYKDEETKKMRFIIIKKYINFLGKYPEVLNKRFPTAMHMYRTFMAGVQLFFKDAKEYFKIVKILYNNDNKFSRLTRRELELYHQMPKDMRKIAPLLLLSTMPLSQYVILPLLYYYPRQLLTQHFWNIQQKSEFSTIYLKHRLKHNKPVFRYLQEQLGHLELHPKFNSWAYVLGMLGSGVQPPIEKILECQELFTFYPYNLDFLRPRHVRHLLGMHDLHLGWFRRSRLRDRALLLQEMDKAILREGGAHNLPVDALQKACYIRGLNPLNMKNEDMIVWLNKWITITKLVNEDSLSLLLHAPILLAYNEPSNWLIIYS